ncbi:hypothetical protein XELAEV_18021507mg [Xenopus laevis]|uniref:Uncharacterized protein n=1 Tax=Xenopus laevis TaxID=8355 RepID=A0A974DBW1_XENLA|nr:hypothetical protein XELAEV_18021507mg [Xenopus laevis]
MRCIFLHIEAQSSVIAAWKQSYQNYKCYFIGLNIMWMFSIFFFVNLVNSVYHFFWSPLVQTCFYFIKVALVLYVVVIMENYTGVPQLQRCYVLATHGKYIYSSEHTT